MASTEVFHIEILFAFWFVSGGVQTYHEISVSFFKSGFRSNHHTRRAHSLLTIIIPGYACVMSVSVSGRFLFYPHFFLHTHFYLLFKYLPIDIVAFFPVLLWQMEITKKFQCDNNHIHVLWNLWFVFFRSSVFVSLFIHWCVSFLFLMRSKWLKKSLQKKERKEAAQCDNIMGADTTKPISSSGWYRLLFFC